MNAKAIITLAAATLCCLACTNEKKQVEEAAYGYCHATANFDIEGATPYCTSETARTTLVTARKLIAMVDSAIIVADKPATIAIVDVRFVSDTVAKAAYHKTTPIKDYIDTVELRKRDGRWLVHSPIEQKDRRKAIKQE